MRAGDVDLREEAEFTTCHPVQMEILMGARGDEHLIRLSRLLAWGRLLATTPGHYDEAAALYPDLPPQR